MLKKYYAIIFLILLTSCAELQDVVNQLPQGGISQADMASG